MRKVLLFIFSIYFVCQFPHAFSAPGNFIKITHNGQVILHQGGVRQNMEIPQFLHAIDDGIEALEANMEETLEPILADSVPSPINLESLGLSLLPTIHFDLLSRGGGEFALEYKGTSISTNAHFNLFNAGFFASGWVRMNTSFMHAAGSYNTNSGRANLTVYPPSFTIEADYGGLGLDFINFVTFGAVDNIFNDFIDDQRSAIQSRIDDFVGQGLNSHTTTLFGIDQIIPNTLVHNGVDYANHIRNLVRNVPPGTLASASYYRLWKNKYKSRFVFKIGNELTIELDHHFPNGTCTGSCRE